MPSNPNVAQVPLPVLHTVLVESELRSDYYEQEYEISLSRDATGMYTGNIGLLGQRWTCEEATAAAEPDADASGTATSASAAAE